MRQDARLCYFVCLSAYDFEGRACFTVSPCNVRRPNAGVHGTVLLYADGTCEARVRRLAARLLPSMTDHHILRYKEALKAACARAGCSLEAQAPALSGPPPPPPSSSPLSQLFSPTFNCSCHVTIVPSALGCEGRKRIAYQCVGWSSTAVFPADLSRPSRRLLSRPARLHRESSKIGLNSF